MKVPKTVERCVAFRKVVMIAALTCSIIAVVAQEVAGADARLPNFDLRPILSDSVAGPQKTANSLSSPVLPISDHRPLIIDVSPR